MKATYQVMIILLDLIQVILKLEGENRLKILKQMEEISLLKKERLKEQPIVLITETKMMKSYNNKDKIDSEESNKKQKGLYSLVKKMELK